MTRRKKGASPDALGDFERLLRSAERLNCGYTQLARLFIREGLDRVELEEQAKLDRKIMRLAAGASAAVADLDRNGDQDGQ